MTDIVEPAPDADWPLVERTIAGDQRAYGLLVLKYQRRIQRLVGRMVRDVDLVEDFTDTHEILGISIVMRSEKCIQKVEV